MVKSVLGVSHQGLTDWLVQRVSALVMAVYSTSLIIYLLTHPGLEFTDWHTLFSHAWMKIASILFITCLLFHAWVGIWTVFTDYIKNFVLGLILQTLVFLGLVSCFFWALQILWGV
ncbi:MAG: succinate dehydrogenase, hydrophobic membrane anchor protein [Gammaproteobacteria bacterium]|nr:succinate dehydrogenase, hydrophobic membrane anchor protein [Gammaproteobacteria bacterium]